MGTKSGMSHSSNPYLAYHKRLRYRCNLHLPGANDLIPRIPVLHLIIEHVLRDGGYGDRASRRAGYASWGLRCISEGDIQRDRRGNRQTVFLPAPAIPPILRAPEAD